MLKTLKWVYDLGIRHERTRIASHLRVASTATMTNREIMTDMLDEEMTRGKPSKKRKERLEFDIAVNHKVLDIINDMFDAKGDWIPGASLMFPDDKHKGEIK